MKWEDALAAAEHLEVRAKQAAYQLSYRYLDGRSAQLAERERWLRLAVASLPAGAELPVDMGRDLFAWKNAIYMAQRRVPSDLPSA